VNDGAEALDVLFRPGPYAGQRNNKPRFVLQDLRLPKVDGLEVLRKMQGDALCSSIPGVVLTSSNEHRDVSEAYKIGANSYISKPVEYSFIDTVGHLGRYWLVVNKPPI